MPSLANTNYWSANWPSSMAKPSLSASFFMTLLSRTNVTVNHSRSDATVYLKEALSKNYNTKISMV